MEAGYCRVIHVIPVVKSRILANIFIIFYIKQSDYNLDAPGQNNIKFNAVDKSTFLWYSWLYRYTVLI